MRSASGGPAGRATGSRPRFVELLPPSPASRCRSCWSSTSRSRAAATTPSSQRGRDRGLVDRAARAPRRRAAGRRIPRTPGSALGLLAPSPSGRRSASAGRRAPSAARPSSAAWPPTLGVFALASSPRAARGCGARWAAWRRDRPGRVLALALPAAPGVVPRRRGRRRLPRLEGPPQLPAQLLERARGADRDGRPAVVVAAMQGALLAPALAAAAIPAMRPRRLLHPSRGGAIELGVALVILLALHPRRLRDPPDAAGHAASAAILLLAAATQRDALEDGARHRGGRRQGDEMLAMALVVCAGVGLVQAAIGLRRHGTAPARGSGSPAPARARPPALAVRRGRRVAAGVPGRDLGSLAGVQAAAGAAATRRARFESAAGNGRYQTGSRRWTQRDRSADRHRAGDVRVLVGARGHVSPGSSATRTRSTSRRSPSSGSSASLLIVAWSARSSSSAAGAQSRAEPERRARFAAATAACAALRRRGGVDWVWELPCSGRVPAARGRDPRRPERAPTRRPPRRPAASRALGRAALVAFIAIVAMVAIAIPLAGTRRSARARPRPAGELAGALDGRPRRAAEMQPYAATPAASGGAGARAPGRSRRGRRGGARRRPRRSRRTGETWLVLSRLEARRGNAEASVDAYRQARSLNPRSPHLPMRPETTNR